jgi:hypothetical protein
MESKIVNPWEFWIADSTTDDTIGTRYDLLCDLVVNSYRLNEKSRKAYLKDRVQFFLRWWIEHRNKMIKYRTYQKIGGLLNVDHTTIVHHLHRRKETLDYIKNTHCIKDFLES